LFFKNKTFIFMGKLRAYVRVDKRKKRVIPGSMVMAERPPIAGEWVEVTVPSPTTTTV
jgi:hypothetical protein